MINFKNFNAEDYIVEAKSGTSYSDEHAHARIWNHMTGLGIAHDKAKMQKEFAKAKTDKTHPLHFSKAPDEGFVGGKKTNAAKESYHQEHENAIHTVHALANHPDFKEAIKKKHKAVVMGNQKGEVSDTWKKYGATKGGTSKSDVAIKDPNDEHHHGLKLSMKKGGGSQLMSGGPEENAAVHHHAAHEMLSKHPSYKDLPEKRKTKIHQEIMNHIHHVSSQLNAMKNASKEKQTQHREIAQHHLDTIHNQHPALNHYVRKEAATGRGKFGEGSAHAASYLVKSASHGGDAEVKHVDKHDWSGPKPRAALPKGEGRSGNVKSDEK